MKKHAEFKRIREMETKNRRLQKELANVKARRHRTLSELLPCPFCGADVPDFFERRLVGCCNAVCPAYDIETTPEKWNRRKDFNK